MRGNFYSTESFDREHRHFGGKLFTSDFNTDYRGKRIAHGSSIANRIEADFRWEKQLANQKPNVDLR